MVNDNSKSNVLKLEAGRSELVTVFEEYSVEDNGIYLSREGIQTDGILRGRQLIMLKDTLIQAVKKYVGGTL